MNVFEKLISEFSSMTDMELAPDRNDSCLLESNGIYITLQYRSFADDLVMFAPVAVDEGDQGLSRAAYEKALSLAYDGKGTDGAFLGLVQGSTKTCVTFCRAA